MHVVWPIPGTTITGACREEDVLLELADLADQQASDTCRQQGASDSQCDAEGDEEILKGVRAEGLEGLQSCAERESDNGEDAEGGPDALGVVSLDDAGEVGELVEDGVEALRQLVLRVVGVEDAVRVAVGTGVPEPVDGAEAGGAFFESFEVAWKVGGVDGAAVPGGFALVTVAR